MEDSNIKVNHMHSFDAVESPRTQGQRETVERLLEKKMVGNANEGNDGNEMRRN